MSAKLVVNFAHNLDFVPDVVLDRAILDLSTERDRYSRAHELGHEALDLITTGAHDTGWAVFEKLVKSILLEALDKAWSAAETPAIFTVAADDRFAECPLFASQAHGLPTWCTNTFVGLPAGTWADSGNADAGLTPTAAGSNVCPACCESPRIAVRIAAGSGQLVTDLLDSLLRFLAFLHSMVGLFERAIEAACLMRLAVRTGLRHRPNTVALVLIVLATCRHYGHRSEPDDHASQHNRRHLVIRGSCPQT